MYVRTYVCMYVCMYVCICMNVCMLLICMYLCIYVCMYVCMYVYVCIYVCMYVCVYVRLLLDAFHLGRKIVRGSSHGRVNSVLFFLEIQPAITISTNNRIVLCSHYIQLFATLCQQLLPSCGRHYTTATRRYTSLQLPVLRRHFGRCCLAAHSIKS